MLGVIFGAMAVMLVLTVPIGVMLLAVALIPSLMDPGFMATVPFVLRNVVGGLNIRRQPIRRTPQQVRGQQNRASVP